MRNHVAAFDLSSGQLLPWDPNADGIVWSLDVLNGTIYMGGEFRNVGGVPRPYAAAVDATTGIVTPWNPQPDGNVNVVKVSESSYRTKLLSVRPSQGTCSLTGCDLGRLGPGASATITAVSLATQIGEILNVVRVGSEEPESNYRNNVASALVRVVGAFRPPSIVTAACRTITAAPRFLLVGRSSIVLVTARNELGRPLRGLSVRARGAGVRQHARTDNRGIARFTMTPTIGGLVFFSGSERAIAASRRCQTRLGVVAVASQPQLTG